MERKDIEELERNRAIKYGGLRMLLVIPIVVLPYYLLVLHGADKQAWRPVSAGFISIMIVYAIFAGSLFEFLPAYFRRNVIGKVAWFHHSTNDNKIVVAVCDRGFNSGACRYSPDTVHMAVPLGGWFHRARIQSSAFTNFWNIRIRTFPSTNAIWCDLTDDQEYRICLWLEEALDLLSCSSYTLNLSVKELLIRANRYRQISDERRATIASLLALVDGTIDKLDATKRFIKSKEAARIREELVADYLALLPSNDPRRDKYAPKTPKPKATASA